jgi:hypothetical protein
MKNTIQKAGYWVSKAVGLCLLAWLLAPQTAVAQRGFHLGFRAMPQSTWMLNSDDADTDKDVYSYEATFGMAAGAVGGYGFNDHIGLVANLVYSHQGQNHLYKVLNTSGELVEVRNELRLNYIKLPIMGRFNTQGDKKFVYSLEVGPQLNFLTSVRESNSDKNYQPLEPPGVTYTNYPDRYDTFKPFLMSAVLGLGVDVKLRYNVRMNVQLRVDYALMDAEQKDVEFQVTQAGLSETVKYYEYNRDPSKARYNPGRPATTNLVGSFGIGFSYIFIPRFHY